MSAVSTCALYFISGTPAGAGWSLENDGNTNPTVVSGEVSNVGRTGCNVKVCSTRDISVIFTPHLETVKIFSCRNTMMVVDVLDAQGVSTGPLSAKIISMKHGASENAKIGDIVNAAAAPVITESSALHNTNTKTLTIAGIAFGTTAGDVVVYLRCQNHQYHDKAVGLIVKADSVSDTAIGITIEGLNDECDGALYASISVQTVLSLEVKVATIVHTGPKIDSSLNYYAQSSSGNRLMIKGKRFCGPGFAAFVTIGDIPMGGSIVACQESLVVVDIADSSNAKGFVTIALITDNHNPVNDVHIGYMAHALNADPELTATSTPIEKSQPRVEIFGTNLASTDVEIFLEPSQGPALRAKVSSTTVQQHTGTRLSVAIDGLDSASVGGSLMATAVIRGVKSNQVTIANIVSEVITSSSPAPPPPS